MPFADQKADIRSISTTRSRPEIRRYFKARLRNATPEPKPISRMWSPPPQLGETHLNPPSVQTSEDGPVVVANGVVLVDAGVFVDRIHQETFDHGDVIQASASVVDR